MNYIAHLSGFFRRLSGEQRCNPSHVSLYMALFQQWNMLRFHNPISVSRSEVMGISRIGSRSTYHKCLRELHAWGYLYYAPSYNPLKGSLVYMLEFTGEQEAAPPNPAFFCHGDGQVPGGFSAGAEQALGPSLKDLNNVSLSNKLKGGDDARAVAVGRGQGEASRKQRKEKGGAEKEKKGPAHGAPTLEEARHLFRVCGYREQEAFRFYHHYSANGWMIGRHPVQHWQAAAHKWACNDFSQKDGSRGEEQETNAGRNYGEPL